MVAPRELVKAKLLPALVFVLELAEPPPPPPPQEARVKTSPINAMNL
jgi:hypothetical protein